MTTAERSRRHREAKKKGINLRGNGIANAAKQAGVSLAAWKSRQAIERHGIPELSGLVGQIGVNLLADMARHTRKDLQRRFVAILEADGAKAARAYARERIARGKRR